MAMRRANGDGRVRIAILARAPQPGLAKTRLIPRLGEQMLGKGRPPDVLGPPGLLGGTSPVVLRPVLEISEELLVVLPFVVPPGFGVLVVRRPRRLALGGLFSGRALRGGIPRLLAGSRILGGLVAGRVVLLDFQERILAEFLLYQVIEVGRGHLEHLEGLLHHGVESEVLLQEDAGFLPQLGSVHQSLNLSPR